MADYIERQAALSRFEQLKEQADTMRDKLYLYGVLAVIDALPAANVREDVHGDWIKDKETGEIYCSECEETAVFTAGHYYSCLPFCPNCGARMTGGGER